MTNKIYEPIKENKKDLLESEEEPVYNIKEKERGNMYKSIEKFTLPFCDLSQPFRKEIEITEGEFWRLKVKSLDRYTLVNRKDEWIEIPDWQFKKCFEKHF